MFNNFKQCYGAFVFDDEEEYDERIAEATKVLEKDKQNHVALNNRGVMYSELGNWEGAEQDLKAAFAICKSDVTLANNLASFLVHQEKWIEALSVASHAIKLDSSYAYSYLRRAEIFRKLERDEEAFRDEEKAKQLRKT